MANRYIPPSLRTQTIAEESFDATSTNAFPTLGTVPSQTKTWGNKTSFKKTIDNLIAYEKLTEQEKFAEAERVKIMEGWNVRSLSLTKERMADYHDKIMERDVELKKAYDEGGFYIYIPPVEIIVQSGKAEEESEEEDTANEESEYVTDN